MTFFKEIFPVGACEPMIRNLSPDLVEKVFRFDFLPGQEPQRFLALPPSLPFKSSLNLSKDNISFLPHPQEEGWEKIKLHQDLGVLDRLFFFTKLADDDP